jgi:hypothetical protein
MDQQLTAISAAAAGFASARSPEEVAESLLSLESARYGIEETYASAEGGNESTVLSVFLQNLTRSTLRHSRS